MIAILLDWIMQPIAVLFLVFLMASGLACTKRWVKSARWLLIPAMAVFWVLAAPGPANALVRYVEGLSAQTATPSSCDIATSGLSTILQYPVVVLAGGVDAYKTATGAHERLHRDSLRRALHAAQWARQSSGKLYVIGSSSPRVKVAQLMRDIMVDNGINSERIETDSQSRSTRENAQTILHLLPPAEFANIVMITSALHVHRAKKVFEHAGYTVCVRPTDSQYAPSAGWVSLLPFAMALQKSGLAVRELLALTLYRMKGYI